MKSLLTAVSMLYITVLFAQTVPEKHPVEEQYRTNYWWWVLGVLLIIAAGIVIYMLIKKDPKRDAVR